ncbi:cytochrome b/b6 domain-containing protein [Paracoccus sp. MBLB3053]|uniref:Cytochrome b/b6 domain-containing protein n=1 Tax=Paracoccus aurantius TaxID=3073814 RepID=A0ABU2HVY1_9RHOB|nr:cytochrome b/b6 domain-containing protein [Paracoccus sp. MBLB3053]MDS9469208.1 cytochrome b/b6 domain-containing protein [Paracoccus sp. MBLB3053]
MVSSPEASEPRRYAPAARLLHWLTVLLVFSTIPAGLVMVQEGLPRPLQDSLFLYHKNIGPVILILVVLRLLLRLVLKTPPLPETLPRLQALAAISVHWLLYLSLLVMALSGIVRVQAGGYPIEFWDPLIGGMIAKNEALAKTAMTIHAQCRYVLIALIFVHVGAAALHGLIKRDGVIRRMWPPI